MTPKTILPKARKMENNVAAQIRANAMRTWDHIVPASCGGKIMVPSCAWCNGKKGDTSLGEWLHSNDLALRISTVVQREPDAEPMHPRILDQLRDEDIGRLRQILNYHADS